MSSVSYESQLRKLFHGDIRNGDTYKEALELVRRARGNCPPGVIGENAVGLSAACAYIASRRLGNTDAPFEVAQQTACLAPKDFQKLVDNIQRYCPAHEILSEPASPKKSRLRAKASDVDDRPERLTYAWLVEQWSLPAMWRSWLINQMQELEAQYFDVCDQNEGAMEDQIKCVVFLFVAQSVNLTTKTLKDLAKTARIPDEDLRVRLELVQKVCGHHKKQLLSMFTGQGTPRANRHANRTLGSASNTPSKRSQPPTPTRSAMKRPAENTPNKPTRTVSFPTSVGGIIRSSQLDISEDGEEDIVPQTPSKRRRIEGSPSKSRLLPTIQEATEQSTASPRKRLFVTSSPSKTPRASARPDASPKRSTKVVERQDIPDTRVEKKAVPQPVRRRFRPVFLDRQQWAKRDSRVDDLIKLGEERLGRWIEKHGDPFVV